MEKTENPNFRIAIFKGKSIRKTIFNKEWYFSVVDICGVLTDSPDAGAYWRKLKQRLVEEGSEVATFCHGLKLIAPDGKMRETDCANTEDMFRIIQSIPSPKAEPLKRWLAKVGYERIQEIENPELATKRTKLLYKLKGYPEDWIEKRMRGIAIREELTDEWQKRGVETDRDYEILTAERYGGGTFAHKDTALEFASWISAKFKFYLIKELQKLKEDKNNFLLCSIIPAKAGIRV